MMNRAFVLLLVLISCELPGQELNKDTIQLELEAVMISATRMPKRVADQNRMVRVISRSELNQMPYRDINEALESIPGIDVRQRGQGGVQGDLSIRGSSYDQVAVLLNGIDLTDAQTGHFNLDLPVPLELIERIEVLSGFGARAIGAGSLSGAINIVTLPSEKEHVALSGRFGSFRSADLSAALHFNPSSTRQLLGLNYSKSAGFAPNTDYSVFKVYHHGQSSHDKVSLSWQLGFLSKSFGAQAFYTPLYPEQFEAVNSGFASLRADYKGLIPFNLQAFYRAHTDRFELFRQDPPTWYKGHNYHIGHSAGFKGAWVLHNLIGVLEIGADFKSDWIWSTVLGNQVDKTPIITYGDATYDHFGARWQGALSASQSGKTGNLAYSAGLLAISYPKADRHLDFFPGGDLGLYIGAYTKAILSVDRTFRLPTFTELYYASPTNQGNSLLNPESSWNIENSWIYAPAGWDLKASLFLRNARETIDWMRLPDESLWQAVNQGEMKTYGVELSGSVRLEKLLPDLRHPWHLSMGGLWQNQERTADLWISKYLLDHIRWKFNTSLSTQLPAKIRMHLSFVIQKRAGTYTAFDADGKPAEYYYPLVFLLDGKLIRSFRYFELFVEATNILNHDFADYGGIPQPGRWLWLGLSTRLNKD